ncbi:probable insulin-like peptide 7 isoform X1 [Macrobrachium rosenbergii]|uniref:probable insulin-like peptide 7 isoform X1 n=1 Tax=Macrobrachium rosenbergii TaxID=79674 RepID=UPI0034D5AF53
MNKDMVVLVLAATVTLLSSASAFDQSLLQRIESRTASEWQAVWSEERLALCRARLRHNLDAICGKDVYRRSPGQGRYKRRAPKCLRTQAGGTSNNGEDNRSTTNANAVMTYPPSSTDVRPSLPDTGQNAEEGRSPFLSVQQANLFVTTWVRGGGPVHGRRRRQSQSITSECCTAAGCTWEEYAEYCPTSSRVRPGVIPI